MRFLEDYWTYHSCYEIPRNYAIYAGLGLLSSIVHRKTFYLHGDIEIHAPMYIGLIGPQGSSKSTCCGFARKFFTESCPHLRIGPSRASPESICKIMSDDKFALSFKDKDENSIEVRPFTFFINEFKNFVGRSPFDMLTFLTDIYDVKAYDASTIARGLELIVNPSVSLLCCETPEWIIRNIKGDIISGGFGRRIIYVYEIDDVEDRPLPVITTQAREAIDRCRQRLRDIQTFSGEFKWTPQAFRLYDPWYRDSAARRRKESNSMMKGYLKSKHIQLFKIMMSLDACSDKPMLCFTPDLFEEGLYVLDAVEHNMYKLWQASGQNELLAAQQSILDFLDKKGEWVSEAQMKKHAQTDLDPREIFSVIRHLEETEQIVKKEVMFPQGRRNGFTTPSALARMQANGEIAIRKKTEEEKSERKNI